MSTPSEMISPSAGPDDVTRMSLTAMRLPPAGWARRAGAAAGRGPARRPRPRAPPPADPARIEQQMARLPRLRPRLQPIRQRGGDPLLQGVELADVCRLARAFQVDLQG